jgi:hypothetical protein
VGEDWCIASAPGWPPGFRAVVRDNYFTEQIAHSPKYVCSPGDQKPHLEKNNTAAIKTQYDSGQDGAEGLAHFVLQELRQFAGVTDPYKQFPYVYPLINLPLLISFGFAQLILLWQVARLRGYSFRGLFSARSRRMPPKKEE